MDIILHSFLMPALRHEYEATHADFFECNACGEVHPPKPGDCCVSGWRGSVVRPPMQGACCAPCESVIS